MAPSKSPQGALLLNSPTHASPLAKAFSAGGEPPSFSLDGDGSEPQLASSTAITLNLITAGLGTGLLTLPWGAAGASIIVSAILIGGVLLLNGWTLMLIVRACERHKEFDLGGLLRHLPGKLGPRLQVVGDSIILFSQFLVLLGYIIVIKDAATFLLPVESIFANRYVLTALLVVMILPVCFLDQRLLAFTSTFSILANIYFILLLVRCSLMSHDENTVQPEPALVNDLCLFGLAPGSITQCDLLMYTIIVHMMIPPMYKELEGRSPEKFQNCLVVAFIALFFILSLVMLCGYVSFGQGVSSNVLLSLPRDIWSSAAQFAMAVCIFGCFPLNVKPCVAPFLRPASAGPLDTPLLRSPNSLLASAMDLPVAHKPSAAGDAHKGGGSVATREILATIGLVSSVAVGSLWIHSLGPLNAINGTIQVLGYIGLIPGATGLYLFGQISIARKFVMYGLVGISVLVTIIGFVFTDNFPDALSKQCIWHW